MNGVYHHLVSKTAINYVPTPAQAINVEITENMDITLNTDIPDIARGTAWGFSLQITVDGSQVVTGEAKILVKRYPQSSAPALSQEAACSGGAFAFSFTGAETDDLEADDYYYYLAYKPAGGSDWLQASKAGSRLKVVNFID